MAFGRRKDEMEVVIGREINRQDGAKLVPNLREFGIRCDVF